MTQIRKWTARLENPNGGLIVVDGAVNNGPWDTLRETEKHAIRQAVELLTQPGVIGTTEIFVVLRKQLKADNQPVVDRTSAYVYRDEGQVLVQRY